MSAQHTKGPWRVAKRFPHQAFFEVEHQNKAPGAASLVVARVTCRASWAEEQEANARLIAAAPDLLAACQVAFDQTCSVGRAKDWEQLRAAIAKATQP